jgi:hypothetical protein
MNTFKDIPDFVNQKVDEMGIDAFMDSITQAVNAYKPRAKDYTKPLAQDEQLMNAIMNNTCGEEEYADMYMYFLEHISPGYFSVVDPVVAREVFVKDIITLQSLAAQPSLTDVIASVDNSNQDNSSVSATNSVENETEENKTETRARAHTGHNHDQDAAAERLINLIDSLLK